MSFVNFRKLAADAPYYSTENQLPHGVGDPTVQTSLDALIKQVPTLGHFTIRMAKIKTTFYHTNLLYAIFEMDVSALEISTIQYMLENLWDALDVIPDQLYLSWTFHRLHNFQLRVIGKEPYGFNLEVMQIKDKADIQKMDFNKLESFKPKSIRVDVSEYNGLPK